MNSYSASYRPFLIALVILLSASYPLCAQEKKDTTLNEVQVKTKHNSSADTRVNDFVPGQKVTAIDSNTLQQYHTQNMATLLSQQLPIFVNSYGVNGLATVRFRGASAAQSQVMWNSVPIQNAALGIADISTMPVLFMDRVNVVYGGNSALWGSGTVGGALLLEQRLPTFTPQQQWTVSAGLGSYGMYLCGGAYTWANARWYVSANAFTQVARNNFSYTDASGQDKTMPNSKLRGSAVMAQASYKANEHNTLGLHAWYQQYEREIPPALFEPGSEKNQTDASLRLLADWTHHAGTGTWYAKASLIHDELRYTDDAIQLASHNATMQYYGEAGWRKTMGAHGKLLLFVPARLNTMEGTTHNQQRIALAGAYTYSFLAEKLHAAINAREEVIDGRDIFLPGANLSFEITRWLVLRASAQRTYRAPTLNELYYNPGGNSSLLSEQGWNEDAGYQLKTRIGEFSLLHDASVYNRNIKDWIIWLGGAIWTPHNIAEVHSRGVETENKLTWSRGRLELFAGVNTSYVLATTVSSAIPGDNSKDKQIPYTPRYNGQVNIGGTWKHYTLTYNHTYTGYRFTTFDESSWLEPYNTGNIQAMWRGTISGTPLLFTLQANNIWDQRYYIVSQRPMPGINLQLGFRAEL